VPVISHWGAGLFAESGEHPWLFNKYAMDAVPIAARVEKAFKEWSCAGHLLRKTNAPPSGMSSFIEII